MYLWLHGFGLSTFAGYVLYFDVNVFSMLGVIVASVAGAAGEEVVLLSPLLELDISSFSEFVSTSFVPTSKLELLIDFSGFQGTRYVMCVVIHTCLLRVETRTVPQVQSSSCPMKSMGYHGPSSASLLDGESWAWRRKASSPFLESRASFDIGDCAVSENACPQCSPEPEFVGVRVFRYNRLGEQ